MKIARSVVALAVAVSFLLVIPPVASADAVWGTGLVFGTANPEYEGYWEYCFHIWWDTTGYGGQGLSHTTIYLALQSCTCACDAGFFAFRLPAGGGIGEDGCDVEFLGEFDCYGDPHFPVPGPTVKFEPVEGECEPGPVGVVHVCYYSRFPPTERGYFEDHIGIKFGQHVEVGDLDGVLPYCECDVTPVSPSSWGLLKAIYRGE